MIAEFRLVAGLFFTVLLTACGAPELSREKAAELIRSHTKIETIKSKLLLQKNASQTASSLGWWEMKNGVPVNLRGKISQEAKSVDQADFGFTTSLSLNTPATIVINVTGVTGENKSVQRIAEFTWNYKDLSPLSRWLAVEGGTGIALFQLYDDGWRIQDVKIAISENAYPLSEKDSEDMKTELAAEATRRAEVARIAEEKRRALEARQRAAMASTRSIKQYRFDYTHGTWGAAEGVLDVRDADVVFSSKMKRVKGMDDAPRSIPYAKFLRSRSAAGVGNNNGFCLGTYSVLCFLSVKESAEIIASINTAHKQWQEQYADVIASCPQEKTWGCVPMN